MDKACAALCLGIIAQVAERCDERSPELAAAVIFAVCGTPSHLVGFPGHEIPDEPLESWTHIGRCHPVELTKATEDPLPDVDFALVAETTNEREIVRRVCSALEDIGPRIGDRCIPFLAGEGRQTLTYPGPQLGRVRDPVEAVPAGVDDKIVAGVDCRCVLGEEDLLPALR